METLTSRAVELARPKAAEYTLSDDKVRGLGLRVRSTGIKSWTLTYRFEGRQRKLTLGPYPGLDLASARDAAQIELASKAKGVDPAAAKQSRRQAARVSAKGARDLVETVVTAFVEKHAKAKTRDWRETERLLKKDVVGEWRGRRLSEIGKSDIADLLDKIIERGAPVGANRTFAQLRKMCKWAVGRGIIDVNPCQGIDRPSKETSRDRVLNGDELSTVWKAASTLGFPFGPIVQLLLLTGQRRDEVAHARWSEFDLANKNWTIPAERAKNRLQHNVPLSARAIAILKTLPRFERKRDEEDFLFSAGKTPPSGFSKAKPRLDQAIVKVLHPNAAPETSDELQTLKPFVLHDLRRSVATGMQEIGINLPVVEKVLNHVSGSYGGIVGIYQRGELAPEKRAALDAWARHVERLIAGKKKSNVVELSSARA